MYASFNVICIHFARVVLLNLICNTVCHKTILERYKRCKCSELCVLLSNYFVYFG